MKAENECDRKNKSKTKKTNFNGVIARLRIKTEGKAQHEKNEKRKTGQIQCLS